MLDVNKLSIVIRDRKFVENLSFSLDKKEKLAIIGEEGNGKSTLAKAIAKQPLDYAIVSGKVNLNGQSVAYLEQYLPNARRTVDVWSFLFKENEDEYVSQNKETNIYKNLKQFGLGQEIFSRLMSELSGGECVKVRLVKILASEPDILVLDEPTNDLDIETLVWLEQFIKDYEGTIIFISHDETLLENCATAILHIERLKKKTEAKVTFERLTYGAYLKKRSDLFEKESMIAQKQAQNLKHKEERWRQIYEKVRSGLNSISRRDPSGGRLLKKKMKSVKAQQGRLEKDRENLKEAPSRENAIFVQFADGSLSNRRVIFEEENMPIFAGDRLLCEISLSVLGQDKVVLIGKNGVGKTTLLKAIKNRLEEKHIAVGYMPQDYDSILNGYDLVTDFCFEELKSKQDQTQMLTMLGALNFTSEEVQGKICGLSGGQKAKLFLAKLMKSGCDVLLLDEPTRNLSPLSCPIIREALQNFNGAIIAVSHDRKLIDCFDRVLNLTKEGLQEL